VKEGRRKGTDFAFKDADTNLNAVGAEVFLGPAPKGTGNWIRIYRTAKHITNTFEKDQAMSN
jgi:hypothetical protein